MTSCRGHSKRRQAEIPATLTQRLQFFFDTDHVVIAPRERHGHDSQQHAGRGRCGVVSPGHVAGDQAADPGRERLPYTFELRTRPEDDSVFSNNNFVYGVRGAG